MLSPRTLTSRTTLALSSRRSAFVPRFLNSQKATLQKWRSWLFDTSASLSVETTGHYEHCQLHLQLAWVVNRLIEVGI